MIANGLNQIGANPYVYRLVTGAVIRRAMYADALSRGALFTGGSLVEENGYEALSGGEHPLNTPNRNSSLHRGVAGSV
jgi:hypothetical protein